VVALVMTVARRRGSRVVEEPDILDETPGWGPPPVPVRDGAGPAPLVGAVTGWRGRSPAPGPERTDEHAAR